MHTDCSEIHIESLSIPSTGGEEYLVWQYIRDKEEHQGFFDFQDLIGEVLKPQGVSMQKISLIFIINPIFMTFKQQIYQLILHVQLDR